MKLLFSPPSIDDLIRLLKAWRFWLLGAVIGAVLGAVVYFVAPPQYRARATVNVDFNLEQAWPKDTDRQQFYYLERETRKLEEIAWSDAVMQAIAQADGKATVNDLRDKQLQLSQPAEAGWHFYADDQDPNRAQSLASTWAHAFSDAAKVNIASQAGLNSYIQLEVTQSANLPVKRRTPLSSYLLTSALIFLFLGMLFILFFDRELLHSA